MVTTLQRRVGRLEESAGGECPYCGEGGGDDNRPYEVIWDDEVPEDLEENCPECGRELIITVYFEDDPRAPWNV